MTPAAYVGMASIAIVLLGAIGKMLIVTGRILTRIEGMEKGLAALATFEAHKAEVEQRLRSCESRLKELEKDRKEHGDSLHEIQGEMRSLREAMKEHQSAMKELTRSMKLGS